MASAWRSPHDETSSGTRSAELDGGLPSVAVLLSTFNGSKYLTELLDSVLSQRGVDLRLFVRDGGSTDGTVGILREYEKANENVVVILGANAGVIASFNELMGQPDVGLCDYVAFCDQDDVWLEDKLSSAIDKLKAIENNNMPVMYCSNLTVVDEKLNVIKKIRPRGAVPTRESMLVQNIGTGYTEVFNQRARELYLLGVGSAMEMHDYWMTLVCKYMGQIIYDDCSHILYRQHAGNVVGVADKELQVAMLNIVKARTSVRTRMLRDFLAVYGCYLGNSEKHIVGLIACYDCS